MTVMPDILESRKPPHSIEAEQAVLGAIIMNNDVFWQLIELRGEHFFEAVHQRIFETIEALIRDKKTANPVVLKTFFENDESLKEVGGSQYIGKLATAAVAIFNINELADLIIEMHRKRALIELGESLVGQAYIADLEVTAKGLIESTEATLSSIVSKQKDAADFDADGMVADYQKFYDEALNPDTDSLINVHRLERFCDAHNVFADGNLVCIAGRPGMGKTAFALSCMRGAAHHGFAGLFFSMEMQANQITARLMADIQRNSQAPIPYKDFLKPTAMDTRHKRVMAAAHEDIKAMPLSLNTRPGLRMEQIYSHCRRVARLCDLRGSRLRLVTIDYLQLMRHENFKLKRYEQIGEDIRAMKTMAKELSLCVVVVSQLNRGVEQREDKRPTLADLAESGAIEQACDIILFPFREAYYLQRVEPKNGGDEWTEWDAKMARAKHAIEIIIAKIKNGNPNTHNLFCDITTNSFMDP
ncbi:MAG: DnaB-like helicase C-terminal domain-containing protein [Pseudomonadota bacterium]